MLTATDIFSLEEYSRQRPEFRARALAHRKQRQVSVGDHVMLSFEDKLTVQYQIQEMLRIERAFEIKDVQAELDAYNPLIPSGRDLCATMMIEYSDPEVRRQRLIDLAGIEHRVYLQVDNHRPCWAQADQDLPRGDINKTSAVHFLQWRFTEDEISDLHRGSTLTLGIMHDRYEFSTTIVEPLRKILVADFS